MKTMNDFRVATGLIIDEPWITHILNGDKTWEMRSAATRKRERIGLIRKGSGMVVGEASLVDCLSPLTREEMLAAVEKHQISAEQILSGDVDSWCHPWVLQDVIRYEAPIPYDHPSGAVIWVRLNDTSGCEKQRTECGCNEESAPRKPSQAIPVPPIAELEGDPSCLRITLTAGNIEHNHFYLTSCRSLLPQTAIGGRNKNEQARDTVTLIGAHGEVVTDIDGSKNIFRKRGWVGSLFRAFDAKPGDMVVLKRKASLTYHVSIERPSLAV
jgi:hypothetical protein